MLFRDFALYLQKIEKVSARLEMTVILAELFQVLSQEKANQEVILASYLMQGSLVPSYQSLEFQMSEKMLLRTLARLQAAVDKAQPIQNGNLFAQVATEQFADLSSLESDLAKLYKKIGDMGELFTEVLNKDLKKSAAKLLSITQVYQLLHEIAMTTGLGSQEKKVALLFDLLKKVDTLSAKYISRIVLGKMRLGFSTMTMIDALSFVKNGNKSDSANLEKALFKKADLGKLAQAYLIDYRQLGSAELLVHYQVELGVPVLPVLCQRLNSAQEIIEKMGEVIAEPKYDGLRVQIHINKQRFVGDGLNYKAFTRNLEDVTHMFPELATVVATINADNCILDTEAVGIDKKTGRFLPFQETIQRKRKHGVSGKAQEIPICFYVFDLLFLNDKSLIDETLLSRKQHLAKVVADSKVIKKTVYTLIKDPIKLKIFHEQQLALGLEGAVMKQGASKYVAGRKSWRWVKIKEEEGSQGKLSDTIDCLMLGYYLGKGKRQTFGIGALLVGVLDHDQNGELVVKSLSKIGTGLTDQQFREVKKLADQHLSPHNRQPTLYQLDKHLFPDVWLEPFIVLEIAADEISKSPIHSAGVALRFPRLVRIRKDKSFEDATTLEELTAIHIAG